MFFHANTIEKGQISGIWPWKCQPGNPGPSVYIATTTCCRTDNCGCKFCPRQFRSVLVEPWGSAEPRLKNTDVEATYEPVTFYLLVAPPVLLKQHAILKKVFVEHHMAHVQNRKTKIQDFKNEREMLAKNCHVTMHTHKFIGGEMRMRYSINMHKQHFVILTVVAQQH